MSIVGRLVVYSSFFGVLGWNTAVLHAFPSTSPLLRVNNKTLPKRAHTSAITQLLLSPLRARRQTHRKKYDFAQREPCSQSNRRGPEWRCSPSGFQAPPRPALPSRRPAELDAVVAAVWFRGRVYGGRVGGREQESGSVVGGWRVGGVENVGYSCRTPDLVKFDSGCWLMGTVGSSLAWDGLGIMMAMILLR